MGKIAAVRKLLHRIYAAKDAEMALARITRLLETYRIGKDRENNFFSQEDVVLITYADTLFTEGVSPLGSLHEFAKAHLHDAISTFHFLPFFPFSSDDGFAVKDFYAIDPPVGSWEDVRTIGRDFDLMFDYVVNHFSAQGQWFANYLAGKKSFENFAIEVDPSTDLSHVTRPRALPLLTAFRKNDGTPVHLWTTFSADQIDFNFKSIDVLEKMIDVLLFYVEKGARILRLDAIAYLWKEIGTACIHLPQTHAMVKLFRSILDIAAPHVMLLTETNVPHHENISYFGNGRDEAQMVYNFTLPPLLLYSFLKEDASVLSQWAKKLQLESETTTFLNFTASHDGIGVRPLEGILAAEEISKLIAAVNAAGGRVSCKRNADGSQSPYELNISYVDAILADPDSRQAQKFLASQALQYVLPGVPATYIHSLLGSRNWLEGVRQTGRARTINRQKLRLEDVRTELSDPYSFRSAVFFPYLNMIKIRKRQPAFHPQAGFEIMELDPTVFAIKRFSKKQTIYALTNVSSRRTAVSLSSNKTPPRMPDLITGAEIRTDTIGLDPFQFMWLTSCSARSSG